MFEIREEFRKSHPDLVEKINKSDYSFLYENEHLGDRIILLTIGGSHAYGLNNKDSDLDIRGVALHSKEELLGTSNFEQFLNQETDTVIYSISKFISLASQCNPNIIEILGCRDEDYLYISPLGQLLLDNKDLFISKKAAKSFSGYATSQLRRIQTATARDTLTDEQLEKFIMNSTDNAKVNIFNQQDLEKYGDLDLVFNEDTKEIEVNVNFDSIPLGKFYDLMNTMKQVRDEYKNTAGRRNHKKDEKHLNKHASHLVRLLKMGSELLETGNINTYREDKDLLLSIKNGEYMKDGLFFDDFYKMVDELEQRFKKAEEESKLQSKPDYKKIEKLLIEINKASLQ